MYQVRAFEQECPKCARLGAQAPRDAPPAEEKATLTERIKTTAKDTASQFQAVPLIKLPKIDAPELGWTLTICLWIFIVLNLLLIALALLAGQVGLMIGTIIRMVGVIGILRCQRWGFYVFAIFVVFPTVMSLFFGGMNRLEILMGVVPSLMIFFLTLMKWDRLD